MGSVIGYQEAHGPVATFETDVAWKIKNLVIDINPVQSGTGDPSPDNIRPITGWTGAKVTKCGKNLLDDVKRNVATDTTVFIGATDVNYNIFLKAGTYTISCDSEDNYGMYYRKSTDKTNRTLWNSGLATRQAIFTIEKDGLFRFWVYRNTAAGGVDASKIKTVQLELGSTATEYEPYQGETYDITFPTEPGTVYGGTINVTKGTLTVNWAKHTITEFVGEPELNGFRTTMTLPNVLLDNTGYGPLYCNMFTRSTSYNTSVNGLDRDADLNKIGYNRYGTLLLNAYVDGHVVSTLEELNSLIPSEGCQIVYPVEPATYQLSPWEIDTIIGTNTIYANTGDTSVLYPKTITPEETVSNVNLLELRRSIMMAMQRNYIPDITTYGVEWYYSDPSTILTRTGNAANFSNPIPAESLSSTGSSPFDNIYPWSEMKRYNIINGEVAYSEDDAGYSETDYDTVVYIPTFYYKAEKDTTNQKWNWSISGKPIEGYEKHPGSGCYVGRFHTSGDSSAVFTKGGAAPLANVTRANFRTYSAAKGTGWHQIDLKTWSAIQMLYLVEFANWHSQSVLGTGQDSGSVQNTGATTGAAYHTIKRSKASNTYRWIENPFSNVYTFVDGYVASSRASYIATDPANYGESTTGMEAAGITLPSTGYITGLGYSEKCPWAFIPDTASSGSASTYIPDSVNSYSSGARVLYVGGYCSNGDYYGAFFFYANHSTTRATAYIGSRLIYIPTT